MKTKKKKLNFLGDPKNYPIKSVIYGREFIIHSRVGLLATLEDENGKDL